MLTCLPHVIACVQGVIESGGVQWMTAGRGIIHSEMPKVTEGDLWGFQLWINLPKKDKMTPPQYALVKQILFHHHYGPFDRCSNIALSILHILVRNNVRPNASACIPLHTCAVRGASNLP